MWNRIACGIFVVNAAAAGLLAQTQPGSFRVTPLPADAPVELLSADWGDSRVTTRGGAMLLELHSTLQFKNKSARRPAADASAA